MSNTAYYTGEGVLNYAGVDYAYGAALPADLPAETLQGMLSKGKASATKPVSQERAEDGEVEALQRQVEVLQHRLVVSQEDYQRASDAASAASVEMGDLQIRLSEVTAERDAARDAATTLEQQLAAANATVEDLTKQMMSAAPAAPAAPAPAPTGKGK